METKLKAFIPKCTGNRYNLLQIWNYEKVGRLQNGLKDSTSWSHTVLRVETRRGGIWRYARILRVL